MDKTRQRYLSGNETRGVQTMRSQDEFKKNKRDRDIVRMTRVFADQRRSLNRRVRNNRHKETLEAAVMDLDGTDMFLEHDWLVKHNPEVN